MQIKDKLISNATYLSLYSFSITFFSMLFWIIIGKMLSPESYGVAALSIQTSTFLSSLCLFGLGEASGKLISELLERKQKDKIQGLILFSLKLVLVSSLVIAVGVTLVSFKFPSFLKLQPKALLLTVASAVVLALVTVLTGVYSGFQNMRKVFLTEFYGGLSKVILVIFLIFFGFDYFGPIGALLLAYSIVFLTRMERGLFKISKKSIVDKKLIFKYSNPAFVVAFFSAFFSHSQLIILSSMKTAEVTGLFAVALKISYTISVIPAILSNALGPITSGLSADKNSKPKQSYLIRLMFRYSTFLVLPMTVFMILFSKYLVLFFSSAEYLQAADFLPLVVFGELFFGLASLFLSSLYLIGEPKKYRDTYIITTAAYLIMAITFTYYFSVWGLAVSYILSKFLMLVIALIFIRRYLVLKFSLRDISKAITGVAVSSLFLIFMKPFIPNLWVAAFFVTIAGFIYLIILLKLNFYLEEDLRVLDFVAEKMPMFKRQIIQFRNYLSEFVTRSYKY